MVSTQLISTLKKLDRSAQFYVMQILLEELSAKESNPKPVNTLVINEIQSDPLLDVIGSLKSTPMSALEIETELYG
ncbi:MAG: hypothetical protein LH649_02880 [Pseudanabaena sp. CAN_BIN31]|nr:hypothetical protein [Pseudanabaena sp. CAN_BIN31]